jgi:hypothetical protein
MLKYSGRGVRAPMLANLCTFVLFCLLGTLTGCQQQKQAVVTPTDRGFTTQSTGPWAARGVEYSNAQEYVVTGKTLGREREATGAILGHMLVTTEIAHEL